MNKSIQTILAFSSLFLASLSWGEKEKLVKVWDAGLETSSGIATSQKALTQDLQTSWGIVTHEEKPMYTIFMDGGSIGIHFKKNEESIGLYHDRSYKTLKIEGNEDFPESEHWVKRTDGLLYLGQKNFKDRNPINTEDPLILELEASMIEYLDTSGTDDEDIKTFLKTLKMMRSNQAAHTMSANARLYRNDPMEINLNRLGTSTEADIVWL